MTEFAETLTATLLGGACVAQRRRVRVPTRQKADRRLAWDAASEAVTAMREAVAAARRDRSAGVVWTATDVLERDAKNTLPATKFWMLPLPEDARASLRVEKAMKATLDSMTAADGDLDARYDAFRSELFHFEFLMRDLLGA